MIKIIITGASGFIGTNLLNYYLAKGFEVLNIDCVKPKIKENERFWVNVDITNYIKLEKVILEFNPDYIVHLAARTDLSGKSIVDYAANTFGVENILKVAQKISTLKKILITSSMLVCKVGYKPKSQFDFKPSTIYGESKIITENNVWKNRPLCDWAIIRPTSIWGPWFGEPYCNFFKMVISHKYFHIGNRSCIKTYGYVGNAVYQIDKILFSSTMDDNNKVFYIGDKPGTNIEEWANEIASQLGSHILKMPYPLIKLAAILGDCLLLFGFKFPMTSFRLNNMTTNNIIDLENTYKLAPNPPFTQKEGVTETLKWFNRL